MYAEFSRCYVHGKAALRCGGINVDLGLLSAAAASHDIGKPWLPQGKEGAVFPIFTTVPQTTMTRFGLPTIMHIAANRTRLGTSRDRIYL